MLHHRLLYAPIHKLHHKYKETTPFSSYAFHPLDGWLQGCPYHIFVFLFPMVELATLFSPRYYYAAKTPLTHDTPYGPRNHTHPGVAATLAGRMGTTTTADSRDGPRNQAATPRESQTYRVRDSCRLCSLADARDPTPSETLVAETFKPASPPSSRSYGSSSPPPPRASPLPRLPKDDQSSTRDLGLPTFLSSLPDLLVAARVVPFMLSVLLPE